MSMRIAVVGGGSWGTAFARLLADRGHRVTLACRDREQVAAIRETGRNPRYMTTIDLRDVEAVATTELPEDTELHVLAVRLAQRVSWQLHRPTARPAGLATFAPKGGVSLTITHWAATKQ